MVAPSILWPEFVELDGLLDPARPGGPVTFAFCFAHSRRKFYDIHVATGSPIAAEAVRRISEFYAIEDRIRGKSADTRCAVRQAETKPLMEDFQLWLDARLGEVSQKSGLPRTPAVALEGSAPSHKPAQANHSRQRRWIVPL
jgi:hypothetical protein